MLQLLTSYHRWPKEPFHELHDDVFEAMFTGIPAVVSATNPDRLFRVEYNKIKYQILVLARVEQRSLSDEYDRFRDRRILLGLRRVKDSSLYYLIFSGSEFSLKVPGKEFIGSRVWEDAGEPHGTGLWNDKSWQSG